MTSGIMGLTRPRFGKRSGRSWELWREVLRRGRVGQINIDKLFSQLTQPRFGKRNPWRCMWIMVGRSYILIKLLF